jgi:hypothetical protein
MRDASLYLQEGTHLYTYLIIACTTAAQDHIISHLKQMNTCLNFLFSI